MQQLPAERKRINGSVLTARTVRAVVSLTSFGIADVQQNSESEVIEEIVVTGSRFERDPNLAGTLPVQTVTAERIRLSGELEVSSVLRDIPALQSSSASEPNFGSQGFTGPNTNVLSLRAPGNERTLTLVNGRRRCR